MKECVQEIYCKENDTLRHLKTFSDARYFFYHSQHTTHVTLYYASLLKYDLNNKRSLFVMAIKT